ncbi:MAG: peptide deformylase [Candidatus Pacebacteria bacterium]|jgi:peptide deformylase|nr:peptide deformylase [bacterium]MDP6527429.1 peptide deformylase [Candidatus Paceibacterota bacterium]MDP6659664.1 peptide deformylase [Candidatus Paceibacterota bacterium]|tara:strand:- start:4104 stop:4604 length:501 start_codon:yes stop_codon:yes gene_type:complete
MVREILQENNKTLREQAKSVPVSDISGEKIQKLLSDMRTTLGETEKGVAIAAPQIGESLRIFVVSPHIFSEDEKKDLVFINPEITNRSKEETKVDEGCLSVDGKYGLVKRAEKVTVRACDENGNSFMRGASGLLAQIFQHEIDHLNGVLYTDIAEEVNDTVKDGKS